MAAPDILIGLFSIQMNLDNSHVFRVINISRRLDGVQQQMTH